ncbi:transcriptional regulator family: Fungal Specific TF [Aspergillus niger]|nr:transcriptional regulator family: Fungal Specific TF [Aspergillus niger]KAI2857800.1 transcriptional regulator family: Fungal Specific TF [Aspergillus niger]KAI2890321.1 transcriptional regulator family: Fungal Specific TF [Aspergillus niger]KAI2920123.1 transcriptional regulator family: Fungal Specific TF [Aspergillus niger]KAI2949692.1 transcriptional regulator family: Fungal Specific TF [Aspergillus niger]
MVRTKEARTDFLATLSPAANPTELYSDLIFVRTEWNRQMRKGTRSCTACRRRKVRCIFPSEESDVCSNCARRGSICVPQGVSLDLGPGFDDRARLRRRAKSRHLNNQSVPQATPDGETISGSDRFSDVLGALKNLEKKVHVSLGLSRNHAPARGVVGTSREVDSIQSDRAPIMKLLNHELIGRVSEPEQEASQQVPSQESKRNKTRLSNLPTEHAEALKGLLEALPTEPEMSRIFQTKSDWWNSWRESFGLSWGDEDDFSLEAFAIRTFQTGHPALVGSLLLCFALSTGDFARYLPPVEHWILNNDEVASSTYGLQCLIGLGLCFMSSLQPRRAWATYRKANTLLQLAGIHRTHRKSKSLNTIFWQLFSADRWVSLLIGLPYSVPENLCDLYIPPPDEELFVNFHYRHLSILTGRVIDCLQSEKSPTLSMVTGVDEQIDEITAHLPVGYLDLGQIRLCRDAKERHTRAFRLAHVHSLKAQLYMPLFLQESHDDRQEYSRMACVRSARTLLEAYLLLHESDPAAARSDNSIKQSAPSALTAAVIVFLNMLGYGRNTAADAVQERATNKNHDDGLIKRILIALDSWSENQPGSLSGQCHATLKNLVESSQELHKGERREIVVPYFGRVTVDRGEGASQPADSRLDTSRGAAPMLESNVDNVATWSALSDDIFLSYSGPWTAQDDYAGGLLDNTDAAAAAFDWITGPEYGFSLC